jgi:hypothetical protein
MNLEPNTPEEVAIRVILDAKIETDEDYVALARLIDDEVSDYVKDEDHA